VESSERRAIKLVKLHASAIRCVSVVGNLLVTGAANGHVRLFSHDLRVVAWFEEIDAGAVTAVSFAYDAALGVAEGGAQQDSRTWQIYRIHVSHTEV